MAVNYPSSNGTRASDGTEARFRVHVAPLGYEIDRLLAPALSLHADVVVLLTGSTTEREPARRALDAIRKGLAEANVRKAEIQTELWDTALVVDEIGAIIRAAPAHEYFFNLSTGPKPACLAGALAVNFWGVRGYYQPVNYNEAGAAEGNYPAVRAPQFLTRFATPTPNQDSIHAMQCLVFGGGSASKKSLLSYLTEKGVIRSSEGSSATRQSQYGQLDTIITRLEGWGFVRTEGHRREQRIFLTGAGKGGLKMFHHLLFPKPAPPELRT